MEAEKSISQLVSEAKETGKFVVLMAGEGHEKMALEIARMKNVATTEVIIIKTNNETVLDAITSIKNLQDVIIVIEDIDKMMGLPILPPKPEIFKLHAMPRDAYEPLILSDKKTEFGVSKNKKTFSPPKHKGFINNKVNHRGKHR